MKVRGVAAMQSTLREALEAKKHEAARVGANKLVDALKKATPVDTGHARDSWHTVEKAVGVSVVNDCGYIEGLNEGHSAQAPSHFIEQTVLEQGNRTEGTIVKYIPSP